MLNENAAADECFKQANRSKSGKLTPGEILLQMQEANAPEIPTAFPPLFLALDVDGDNLVTRQDLSAQYAKVARPAGLRPKVSEPIVEKSADEMAQFEKTAMGYLQPKIDALMAVFKLLEINDGTGRITARKLNVFKTCLVKAKVAEMEAQAAATLAELQVSDPKAFKAAEAAAKAAAEAGERPKIDPRDPANKHLMLDLETAFQELVKSGKAKADKFGEVGIDFAGCRAMLARHAGALEGVGGGGGGKKGKKKK